MIVYKDRRFCSQKCANTQCNRNINDIVIADAKKWWATYSDNGSPPINMCDLKTDGCGYLPDAEYSFESFADETNDN